MKEKKITYDEVMAELEKYNPIRHGGENRYQFTKEMDNLILKCRKKKMSFHKIQDFWNKLGWEYVGRSTIRRRYYQLNGIDLKE